MSSEWMEELLTTRKHIRKELEVLRNLLGLLEGRVDYLKDRLVYIDTRLEAGQNGKK